MGLELDYIILEGFLCRPIFWGLSFNAHLLGRDKLFIDAWL